MRPPGPGAPRGRQPPTAAGDDDGVGVPVLEPGRAGPETGCAGLVGQRGLRPQEDGPGVVRVSVPGRQEGRRPVAARSRGAGWRWALPAWAGGQPEELLRAGRLRNRAGRGCGPRLKGDAGLLISGPGGQHPRPAPWRTWWVPPDGRRRPRPGPTCGEPQARATASAAADGADRQQRWRACRRRLLAVLRPVESVQAGRRAGPTTVPPQPRSGQAARRVPDGPDDGAAGRSRVRRTGAGLRSRSKSQVEDLTGSGARTAGRCRERRLAQEPEA